MFTPLLALSLVVPPAAAAEVGTYTTSFSYEAIEDAKGLPVWFQIHYPALDSEFGAVADSSEGPFPLAVMIHGYMGQAWMYQTACDAFASMGFVVLNMDTETHAWMDPAVLAGDTRTALAWAQAASEEHGHAFEGMVSDKAWTVMGHSMGGISMAQVVDAEANVGAIVGFAPYRDEDYQWDAYATYGGSALFLGGNHDSTSPPDVVQGWFEDVDAPARGLWMQIHGTGHQAVTDIEFEEEELSDAEQLEAVISLASSFLLAEVFGDEDRYDALLCSAPYDFDELASRGILPATSAEADSDSALRLGLAARTGETAVVYAGPGPGRSESEHGELALRDAVELSRELLGDGTACLEVALDDDLAGIAWIQVAFEGQHGTTLGRIIDVFDTGAEPLDTGDTGGGSVDTGGEPQDTGDSQEPVDSSPHDTASGHGGDDSCGGCASGPGGAWLLLTGLLGFVARRRSVPSP